MKTAGSAMGRSASGPSRAGGRSSPCVWLLLGLALLVARADAHGQELRAGVYHNPPKLLLENDQPGGIFGDLLVRLAAAEGWTLRPVRCAWDDCLARLAAGEIDLLPDVAWQPERAELLQFHQEPVLHSWSQVYLREGHQLHSFADLDGKRVALVEGSVQQQYLVERARGFGIDLEPVPLTDYIEVFASVRDGAADVAVANRHFGDLAAPAYALEAGSLMFQPVRLHFAGSPQLDPEVLDRIDARLVAWKSDPGSPWHEVVRYWDSATASRPDEPGWFWWLLAGAVAVALFALLIALLLKRQVARRTRQLEIAEGRLETILDSVDAAIFIKDESLRYQYVNRRVCELLGRPAAEIIGKTDEDLFDARTAAQLRRNDLRVIEASERVVTEEVNTLADTRTRRTYLSVKIPLQRGVDTPRALCGISTDITEHRRVQNELQQLAYYDPLTHLPNRKLLLERLEHAIHVQARTGMEGGMLLIDLDHFRLVNETLGYASGDQLLQEIAGRIQQLLGESDTLARVGSNRFAILLENLAHDQHEAVRELENMARRMLEAVARPLQLGDAHPWVITACAGITLLSEAVEDVSDSLFAHAELALDKARLGGAGTVAFFVSALQDEINHYTRLQTDLRAALARHQLECYLQPQFHLQGHCIGMEMLLRWQHPERGPVPPLDFIPVAEASGLIVELGDWVLAQAVQLLRDWSEHPDLATLPISVNISPRQFREPRFAERVEAVLDAHGVSGDRLTLELTESVLVHDAAVAGETMARLQRRGVHFSLDDFGTGYASLQYLKQLPLGELKIDQTFVRDLLEDPNDAAIVATIVGLGRSLGLAVIAEGVETVEQLARLQELGCERFQGYLLARPRPAASWRQAPLATQLLQQA